MAVKDIFTGLKGSPKNKETGKNTLCVLPWIHLFIIPSGKVLQCCNTSDFYSYAGDLNKQSTMEIWNGRFMRAIRKKMMNGQEPEVCSRCYENERICGTSYRIINNNNNPDKIEEIPNITKKDGSVEKMDLRFWDFRFSNICNYKCRICSHELSSAWIPDAKALGRLDKDTPNKPTVITSIDNKPNIDFIREHIGTVKVINFVGGEPLLTDEHWQILEMLDKANRDDVYISYNTNLSLLKYNNKNVLDYWSKWGKRVLVMASIDEIDKRAELIRSGTNWKNVEANLKSINEIGVRILFYMTVSAMNVFRIPEVFERMTDIGILRNEKKDGQNFEINILTQPSYLHVSILPDVMRRETIVKLQKFINDYEQKYNVSLKEHFHYLFWHLEKPWNEKECRAFKAFTASMDNLRNENTLETFPELRCILE